MLSAGRFKHRVVIRRKDGSRDATGQVSPSWVLVDEVWGDVLHQSGSETIKGQADVSLVRASIRIRRRGDVVAGMRVEHGAQIFDIKAVLPDNVGDAMNLVCEAAR